MNQNQDIHECAHCGGTGTCKHGVHGEACAACTRKQGLKRGTYYGLACGTCGGLGKTDTLRLNNRPTPMLVMSIVPCCLGLILVFGLAKSEYFSAVLACCGTLSGAVIGHYFGKRGKG